MFLLLLLLQLVCRVIILLVVRITADVDVSVDFKIYSCFKFGDFSSEPSTADSRDNFPFLDGYFLMYKTRARFYYTENAVYHFQ